MNSLCGLTKVRAMKIGGKIIIIYHGFLPMFPTNPTNPLTGNSRELRIELRTKKYVTNKWYVSWAQIYLPWGKAGFSLACNMYYQTIDFAMSAVRPEPTVQWVDYLLDLLAI